MLLRLAVRPEHVLSQMTIMARADSAWMTKTTRTTSWLSATRKDFGDFREGARANCVAALTIAAKGGKSDIAKPMKGFGSGVFEFALPYRVNAFSCGLRGSAGRRHLGGARVAEEIHSRHQDPQTRDRPGERAPETIEGDV